MNRYNVMIIGLWLSMIYHVSASCAFPSPSRASDQNCTEPFSEKVLVAWWKNGGIEFSWIGAGLFEPADEFIFENYRVFCSTESPDKLRGHWIVGELRFNEQDNYAIVSEILIKIPDDLKKHKILYTNPDFKTV